MRRIPLYIAFSLLAILVTLVVLGQLSQSGNAPGLVDGRLQPCGDRPNCVCSEYPDDSAHYIAPLQAAAIDAEALKRVLVELGGKIEAESESYIAASFKSELFGFTDDLEMRIDAARNRVHLRSAVRLGYNDMGVNRTRVQRLRELYLQGHGESRAAAFVALAAAAAR